MNKVKKIIGIAAASAAAFGLQAETVKIAYPNWAEGIAMTHLAKVVLEEEMGYDVELTQADPGVIYAAVAQGDQDLFVDGWLPNTHADYWAQYGDVLENYGTTFGNGVTGLVVPAYMDINSIDELNSVADELDGKITGIGTGAGITKNTNIAIDEYRLDLEQVNSSGPAMTAALSNAIQAGKPIVVTGWKPHWKFGRFDLKVLEDPKGVYPLDGLRKVGRPGLRLEMPDVVDFMVNYSLTEDQLLSLMLDIDDSDDDPAAVASAWARKNQPLIESWLPAM
ncbi:MAG: glycine/betaine ABC transporter [Verrucomicrobia bacterium]|jgi:glycine betaine/proline transport system substrate-binding protein|nr:glycine/betaine ABC transporter [Verrucomicrobiota bacterium]